MGGHLFKVVKNGFLYQPAVVKQLNQEQELHLPHEGLLITTGKMLSISLENYTIYICKAVSFGDLVAEWVNALTLHLWKPTFECT